MVLGFGADIDERLVQHVGHQRTLWNGACGHTGDGIHILEVLHDHTTQLGLHEAAQVRIRQSFAVVAIKW